MVLYKGDKFVSGKLFKVNNEQYKFIKKTKQGLVFESAGKKITINEQDNILKEMV